MQFWQGRAKATESKHVHNLTNKKRKKKVPSSTTIALGFFAFALPPAFFAFLPPSFGFRFRFFTPEACCDPPSCSSGAAKKGCRA
jgi:hypothetical protein